jgi:RNAse (barnase) inhibitor barstar
VRVNFDVLFDSNEIELPGEIVLKKAESSKKVNHDNIVEFAL